MRPASYLSLTLLVVVGATARGGERSPRFQLRASDRVVLLGNGLIEQERRFGFLETRLSRRVPKGSLVFRNLGWAGDTVRGIARTGGYQNPEGFARLLKEVQDYKPTVLFIGYGMNESFDGSAGLAAFREDYAKLLDKLAPLKARIVLLSPLYQEDLGRPFPQPVAHNCDIDLYRSSIQTLAEQKQAVFVDLSSVISSGKPAEVGKRLTTNGLQLNEAGSRWAARVIDKELGLASRRWRLELDAGGKVIVSEGVKVDKLASIKGGLRWDATDAMLAADGDAQDLKIAGLPAGNYQLNRDGKSWATASAQDWQRGLSLGEIAVAADAEKLRQAIILNNDWFYRRWRPFNDHSRHWGFIGGDGKLYDQDMAAQEKLIGELRRPRTHQYEIVLTGDAR